MLFGFAPLVTRSQPVTTWTNFAVDPTDSQLTTLFDSSEPQSSGSRRVWGGTVSNLTGTAVTVAVTDYPFTQTTWAAIIAPNSTVVVAVPFFTDRLAVTTSVANAASFTFFHGNVD